MRAPREPALFCFVAALAGLGPACEPDPEITTSRLSLTQVQSCALTDVRSMTVDALGDLPTRSVKLASKSAAIDFDDFSRDTREIEIVASFGEDERATGLAKLAEPFGAQALWMLPDESSCPLGDPLAIALPGAAVSALPRGGLLVAGGRDSDQLSVSSAQVLSPGTELVTQVPDGMLLRRSNASATTVGDLILVAGGAPDDVGSAHDTFEVFDAGLGSFVRERSSKLLTGPRMQHGAAALANGSVLLVGGRASHSSMPLASAELVDPKTGKQVALDGKSQLTTPRVAPNVLMLDSGVVLIVGGRDQNDDVVTSIERYDSRGRRFVPLMAAVPARDALVATALVGGRVAWFACDVRMDIATADLCEVGLLLPVGGSSGDFVREDVYFFEVNDVPHGLSNIGLQALPDGNLLMTGRDPTAAIARRAFVLDVNHAALEARETTRVPDALVTMQDGTIAELDAFGTSLRREVLRSEYASPSGDLLDGDLEYIALDHPNHFMIDDEEISALDDDARFDVAGLRYADVRVKLIAEGDVALLLEATSGEQAVSLHDGKLQLGKCSVRFPSDSALVVTRRGQTLGAASEDGAATCEVEIDAGPVSVAVRAAKDTRVRSLEITRL